MHSSLPRPSPRRCSNWGIFAKQEAGGESPEGSGALHLLSSYTVMRGLLLGWIEDRRRGGEALAWF